ncbi:MAG: N-6 DNA methylase [Thermodesulfovibrionales bacterium]|nr:N-6 DNA methylase [Thermodesulfovibrionales bacterium]
MLDSETKSRIDSARDILVGKVPDPKSQVEQITIALIYKFMDDMDRQSEELGGKATFFSKDFKKYSWPNLLDPRLGGHERLLLYADGIEMMNQNKNIPQLFRDIFKGAFLPYRDPETLNLFLKEINGFVYDHSERLGDAFEYLLSVLGSQGEAGQFRTPRHIIDFIVKIVDPKKNESVLDPACGTAGFLISSFKHIMAANTKERPGDQLSADERGRLMTNFNGYDISPDMVRLSRVNLYLHGFVQPRIYEYDTLTSEERWGESFDVILANPPFMSPKGGIRPHNRFSIKANRSEVLFVDYIAEHLSIGGRAGVIVPEGIIFQSQNAYKTLRKMLVENYLWAVVSLPGGCFNPYSGVKTSILFLDKSLAKRTDEIIFVKIEGDGFGLGAQRRANGRDDLPEALRDIADFKLRIVDLKKSASVNHQSTIINPQSVAALSIKKSRILESPDINLSGDRYRLAVARPSGKWPMVKIGDLCDLKNGRAFKPTDWEKKKAGGLPIIRIQNLNDPQAGFNYFSGKVDDRLIVHRGDLLFSWSGSRGTSFGPHIWDHSEGILNQHIFNVCHKNTVNRKFFYWMLKKAVEQVEENLHGGVGLVHITKGNLERIEVPLPSLEEQERILAELGGYQKVIDGAKQVIAHYKPTIKIDPAWPLVNLGDTSLFRIESGGTPKSNFSEYWDGKISWATLVDLPASDFITDIFNTKRTITERGLAESSAKIVPVNSIIVSTRATIGRIGINRTPLATNQGFKNVVIENSNRVVPEYIAIVLTKLVPTMETWASGGTFKELSKSKFSELQIPLPPLNSQQKIVTEIKAEQNLIAASRELIPCFEKKIKNKLAEIWGEIEVASERV